MITKKDKPQFGNVPYYVAWLEFRLILIILTEMVYYALVALYLRYIKISQWKQRLIIKRLS